MVRAKNRRVFAFWLCLILALVQGPRLYSASVPLKLQVALFLKIFNYDKSLVKQKKIKILVVGPDPAQNQRAVAAWRDAGLAVGSSNSADLAKNVNKAHVVYVMPGSDSKEIEKQCIKHGVLTISGVVGFAEKGVSSVAIGLQKNGRPQIVVHLGRATKEGHKFSSNLLALAKVIR